MEKFTSEKRGNRQRENRENHNQRQSQEIPKNHIRSPTNFLSVPWISHRFFFCFAFSSLEYEVAGRCFCFSASALLNGHHLPYGSHARFNRKKKKNWARNWNVKPKPDSDKNMQPFIALKISLFFSLTHTHTCRRNNP